MNRQSPRLKRVCEHLQLSTVSRYFVVHETAAGAVVPSDAGQRERWPSLVSEISIGFSGRYEADCPEHYASVPAGLRATGSALRDFTGSRLRLFKSSTTSGRISRILTRVGQRFWISEDYLNRTTTMPALYWLYNTRCSSRSNLRVLSQAIAVLACAGVSAPSPGPVGDSGVKA